MNIIKRFQSYFNSEKLVESDLDVINDYFIDFLDEIFLKYAIGRDDLIFKSFLKNGIIYATITINKNINYRGCRGTLIVKEVFYKLLLSDELKLLCNRIQADFTLSDSLTDITTIKKEMERKRSNIVLLDKILEIEIKGCLDFKISPK